MAISQRHQQIDVRKFRVARLNRALYGDAKDVKLTGDADHPVNVNAQASIDVTQLTPEEQADIKRLAAKLAVRKGSE